MRLLDQVASCRTPLRVALDRAPTQPFEVGGPGRYAPLVTSCPHRFVLGDDLTRACAELAFADGERLVGCLDLLRLPAPLVWVEWNDSIHSEVMLASGVATNRDSAAAGRRVGVLLQGAPRCDSAIVRTFWTDRVTGGQPEVTMSPLETHIDLGGGNVAGSSLAEVLSGGVASATDEFDSSMATLLRHVTFRLDDDWARFYRAATADPVIRARIVSDSLAAIVRDAPFLLAFFLLLNARDATRSTPVTRTAINRKRTRRGQSPLLDHVEVSACLEAVRANDEAPGDIAGRQSPRLHHVRGHLVRRDDIVYWRTPHLRGSATRGFVRSRTVCLSFRRTR